MTTTPSDSELSSFLELLARRLDDIHDNDREWLIEAAHRLKNTTTTAQGGTQ
jgi:hypothetical protein